MSRMGRSVSEFLRRIPMFGELRSAEFEEVVALARPRRFKPREVVIRQGERGDSVFIIQVGYLKVFVSGANGTLTMLGVMGPGEVFGELSLLDGGPRSATVMAMTQGETLVIDRAAFLKLVEDRPRVAIGIMDLLARRLRRMSERSDDLSGLRVANRLAKQLLFLAENHSHRLGPSRLRLAVRMSQRELGELVGATRESVNKHLRAWQEEEILAADGGFLAITNLELLRAIAAD
jgi:CRP/FNR family cyclic AMP-dependent transcriptional regulator